MEETKQVRSAGTNEGAKVDNGPQGNWQKVLREECRRRPSRDGNGT